MDDLAPAYSYAGPLRMYIKGIVSLHPYFPDVYLDIFYSERGLPEEIKPRIMEKDGEAFLEGITFTKNRN